MALHRLQTPSLPLNDRGLNYGDGLFETLRVAGGQLPLLQRHLQRLRRGMTVLGLDGDLAPVIRSLEATAAEIDQGLIKLLLVREGRERGYIPATSDAWFHLSVHDLPPPRDRGEGIRVARAETRLAIQPVLAGIKHLNRLEQVLAAGEARERGVDELWLADSHDRLVEGVQSNVFLVFGREVLTPDLRHCGVAGTVREWVLQTLRASGRPCRTGEILLSEAGGCQAAFMTSAAQGIMAVAEIDARPLDPHHELILDLQQAWEQWLSRRSRG